MIAAKNIENSNIVYYIYIADIGHFTVNTFLFLPRTHTGINTTAFKSLYLQSKSYNHGK